jgi:hypothetical protein
MEESLGDITTFEAADEQTLLATTPILIGGKMEGTGFFYASQHRLWLVTALHVFKDQPKTLTFQVHKLQGTRILREMSVFELRLSQLFTYQHDIAAFDVTNMLDQSKHAFKKLDARHILDEKKLRQYTSTSKVFMPGYANGLSDEYHRLPVFQVGHCASLPGLGYENKQMGLLSITGSPVLSGAPLIADAMSEKLQRGFINDIKRGTRPQEMPLTFFLGIYIGTVKEVPACAVYLRALLLLDIEKWGPVKSIPASIANVSSPNVELHRSRDVIPERSTVPLEEVLRTLIKEEAVALVRREVATAMANRPGLL